MKLLLFSVYIVLSCNQSFCQSLAPNKYSQVDIDSLLKTSVVLSNAGYSITNIEFTARYGMEAREILGPYRDRFLQFQDQHPELGWEYTDACAVFKFRDTAMFVSLAGGHQGRLLRLVDSWGDKYGPKVKIRAQMLIGKYLRYGVKRDFLIKDIIVIEDKQ